MGYVPAPRAPSRPDPDADRQRLLAALLAGDPDWPEYKRRWAELYGELEFGR